MDLQVEEWGWGGQIVCGEEADGDYWRGCCEDEGGDFLQCGGLRCDGERDDVAERERLQRFRKELVR